MPLTATATRVCTAWPLAPGPGADRPNPGPSGPATEIRYRAPATPRDTAAPSPARAPGPPPAVPCTTAARLRRAARTHRPGTDRGAAAIPATARRPPTGAAAAAARTAGPLSGAAACADSAGRRDGARGAFPGRGVAQKALAGAMQG